MADEKKAPETRLATAADILQSYKTEIVPLIDLGLDEDARVPSVQIRSLQPLDFAAGFGAHLALKMQQAGKNFEDVKARQKFVNGLNEREMRQLMASHRIAIEECVCKAVESLQLTRKHQADCESGEVSINNFSAAQIWQIWRRINTLSGQPDPGEQPKQAQEV